MNLSTENISETRAKVVVTVAGDEVTAEERSSLRDLSRQAKIPGFRPGKAPEAMLRRRFGKELAEETKRKVLGKAYEHATKESKLDVFGLVEVGEAELTPGQDAEIAFTFDLQPKFELPVYEGIETRVTPAVVADEDMEREVENIRRQRAEFNVVEREAAAGDYVKVTYRGEVDGQPISEIAPGKKIWGTQENTWEEAGATEVVGVPAVVEGVVGMKAGDSKTVTQEFAADHEVEELRGKTGSYSLEVHEVRERVLPELTEEFVESLNVESVDDLRKRIRQELQRRKDAERRLQQRNQIADYLVASTTFAVPDSAIEGETQRVMEQTMRENMRRGVPEEEFDKHKEEFHAQSRIVAQRQVQRDFILLAIARKEEITVTNEDMQRAVMAQATRYRVRPEDFVKELREDRDTLRAFQHSVQLDKIMEWLADRAKVVEDAAAAGGEEPAQV